MAKARVDPRYGPTPADAGVAWMFVSGCYRSGTTAMAKELNLDDRVVMGIERYKYVRDALSPDLFAPELFFNPIPQETNSDFDGLYDRLRERWVSGSVAVFGDKDPSYTYKLSMLEERFPGSRHLVMLRDVHAVANSFHRRATNPRDHWPADNGPLKGAEAWNDALRTVKAFCESGCDHQVHVVDYEGYFSGDERHLDSMYRFLGLDVPDGARQHFAEMREAWPKRASRPLDIGPDVQAEIDEVRDRALEGWARERIERQMT